MILQGSIITFNGSTSIFKRIESLERQGIIFENLSGFARQAIQNALWEIYMNDNRTFLVDEKNKNDEARSLSLLDIQVRAMNQLIDQGMVLNRTQLINDALILYLNHLKQLHEAIINAKDFKRQSSRKITTTINIEAELVDEIHDFMDEGGVINQFSTVAREATEHALHEILLNNNTSFLLYVKRQSYTERRRPTGQVKPIFFLDFQISGIEMMLSRHLSNSRSQFIVDSLHHYLQEQKALFKLLKQVRVSKPLREKTKNILKIDMRKLQKKNFSLGE